MTATEQSRHFGPLLQQIRLGTGMSQAELAERAGLSRRGISDLERGVRRPLPGTARRLALALKLAGQARLDFVSAGRWRTYAPVGVTHREGNLPIALSNFVGRERELAQVRTSLEAARLVTLTGTGGVGKTRLALEVGRGVEANGDQRVCLVELAAITDGSAVPGVTVAAFGLSEQADRAPLDTLKYALRNQQLLLILDNCEQVLQGCAEMANVLLAICPRVRILATSRERLGIAGETVWRVPSLMVPAEGMTLANMQACEATQLFLQRATALVSDFVLTDQNASAVAHLCNRLDGIPLAIELAVAQLPALSVQQIAERLDDALRLLVTGDRTAPPRQQTLGATIAWSYALLDPSEQLLFDRLSVFAGGWTLEAAEQVCADPNNTSAAVHTRDGDVVTMLTRLVAKSLVVATPDGHGAMRYCMLDTLRQYGAERLVERGDAAAISDRQADYFLLWARRHLSPSDTFIPLHAASAELDNLRAALKWLLLERDTKRLLQLGAALRWYWFRQGRLSEGFRWYSEIIALAGVNSETEEVAHVLAAAALIAGRHERAADAEGLHKRALAVWRRLGNNYELARSLSQLGSLFRHTGRLTEAYQCFEEGARLSKQQDSPEFRITEGLNRIGLAETMYDEERYDEALAPAGRALEIAEALHFTLALAWAKRAIGLIHYQRGDRPIARRFLEESLAEARREPARGWWLADALGCVAQLEIDGRRFERAGTLLKEALQESMDLADQRMVARCLERLSYLAAAQGRSEPAVRLGAAAGALRTKAGQPRSPVEARTLKAWLAPAEHRLEPTVLEQVRREGADMPLEGVLTYALDVIRSQGGPTGADGAPSEVAPLGQLSPREREVALLVARGLSNPRIAAELIIGERTVQSHVSNILNKLGLSSRVQVAGLVAEYGPGIGQHNP
jgi:predicted ATPase/DNA-binding CsgD family transcriptional regulator/transcriptional regulator with XRE-family HTH domain